MRNMRIKRIFVYVFCAALLLTMGMNFKPAANSADPASPVAPPVQITPMNVVKSSAVLIQAPKLPSLPSTKSVTAEKPAVAASIPASTSVSTPVGLSAAADSKIESVKLQATAVQSGAKSYEVTAFYLNVRANGYSTSKILSTVKQGAILKVVRETDKGWLQLEGGGYVHGGYATPIAEAAIRTKSASTTASTSATQTIVNADAIRIKPTASLQPLKKEQEAKIKTADIKTADIDTEALSEPNKPKSAVMTDSGLTEAHIRQMLKNTALAGHGLEKVILDVEEEYGVNAYFTIAVMKLESGNGKSKLAKSKNNLFGLNAIDGDKYNKAMSFKTKSDSIRKFGQLIAKSYLGKGYTTIEKIARKYCPANPKWPSLVSKIMKADYRKL